MNCGFCNDVCCCQGVDIDIENIRRIDPISEQLEHILGIPRSQWFRPGWEEDPELPGGLYTRTQVINNTCVFQNRRSRGCFIHAFCLSNNLEYRNIKPMVSALFPVSFEQAVLLPATQIIEEVLICKGEGVTIYESRREDIQYYFGDGLVCELDSLQEQYCSRKNPG